MAPAFTLPSVDDALLGAMVRLSAFALINARWTSVI